MGSYFPAMKTNDMQRVKTATVNLMATGNTTLFPTTVGRKFIPQSVTIRIIAKAGTLVVGPICRIGTNGNHDNMCPLLTVPTTVAADSTVNVPLATNVTAADLSAAVIFEVQTAATGVGLTLTAEIHVTGFYA